MQFDAQAVIEQCNGMLAADAYVAMYEAAKVAPDTLFVEVGTAHGAGTVCLAMGLRDSGREGAIYTIDKIAGGSRDSYGDVNQNIEIIKRNLAHFGVADYVTLIVGDVREVVDQVPTDRPIGLLCLDADGAIDRDFKLFFDRLLPDAGIVIDDVQDKARVKRIGRKRLTSIYKVDTKHRLSFRLVQLFKDKGLLGDGARYGYGTWVGVRGKGTMADVSAEEIVDVYRSLTFTEATAYMVPMRNEIVSLSKKILPNGLRKWLKSIEK